MLKREAGQSTLDLIISLIVGFVLVGPVITLILTELTDLAGGDFYKVLVVWAIVSFFSTLAILVALAKRIMG